MRTVGKIQSHTIYGTGILTYIGITVGVDVPITIPYKECHWHYMYNNKRFQCIAAFLTKNLLLVRDAKATGNIGF